MNNYKMIK